LSFYPNFHPKHEVSGEPKVLSRFWIPLLRRAVDIDPQFAVANAHLGFAYSVHGRSVLAAESTTKAWKQRETAGAIDPVRGL
jgi:hypothetical protein